MFEKRVRETSDCLMRTFSSFCILDVFFAPCVQNICRFITRHFYKCLFESINSLQETSHFVERDKFSLINKKCHFRSL